MGHPFSCLTSFAKNSRKFPFDCGRVRDSRSGQALGCARDESARVGFVASLRPCSLPLCYFLVSPPIWITMYFAGQSPTFFSACRVPYAT